MAPDNDLVLSRRLGDAGVLSLSRWLDERLRLPRSRRSALGREEPARLATAPRSNGPVQLVHSPARRMDGDASSIIGGVRPPGSRPNEPLPIRHAPAAPRARPFCAAHSPTSAPSRFPLPGPEPGRVRAADAAAHQAPLCE